MIGRGVFLVAAVLVASLVVAWRVVVCVADACTHLRRERLLLVGTGPAAIELARELYERRQELGVEIVGFVDPDPARVGAAVLNPGVVGTIDDIPSLIGRLRADRVVVSLADARGKLPMDHLLDSRLRSGVSFDHLASVYEQYTGKIAVRESPALVADLFGRLQQESHRCSRRSAPSISWRLSIGLVLSAPLMAIIAGLTKLTSPGPALYHQERVGLNGHTFVVHKFRTMASRCRSGNRAGLEQHRRSPSRPGSDGILRRTRLDELPQLWNILRGEMSFVGPRPERPAFVQPADRQHPVLRAASRRQAWTDRLGAGSLHVRRERRRRDSEAAVRPLLHQEHVDRARHR